ncbi:MAG: VWA domain-containing protein [Methanosarcinales archaeon]|nr:MAG: VWA domain-containing protein [Methanosarcinales archaeon]
MKYGIQMKTATSKAFGDIRWTHVCLIALVILAVCARIPGAAAASPPVVVELVEGESYDLGYDGYVLTAMKIDPDGEKVWLSLLRYGEEVDSEVLGETDLVYTYHDTSDNPVIKTDVEIIKRGDIGMVRLDPIWLREPLSTEPTISHGTSPTTIDYLHITASVNNGYAITSIEEKLTNPHDTATDDEFRFLIPEGAFISGFSIFIDGVEYEADVLPKDEADERFEAAVSEGRTAGVLKTKKENVFSYSLSFEPHQSIVVRLTYEQPVTKTLGEYEYVLSLRETDVAHSVPDLSVNITVASVNRIVSLETPGFEGASTKYISTTDARVTYSAKTLPDCDLRIVFTTDSTSLNGEMLFYETGGQGYLMHVFSPSEEDLGTTALDKEIIFVVDKSGSMSGDKIVQVKRVFTGIIADLPPDDYFNIIFFDSGVRVFRDTLMEANTVTKAEAANFVAALYARGGTNINEALLMALGMFEQDSERVPIIVFLTDGEPTNGVTSPYVIRDNVKAANGVDVSIFTIAFGIDDEENYDFLRALSLENCGVAEQFYPGTNAEAGMNTFYEMISTPMITGMDFSYSDSSDVVNTGYGTLFAGSDAIMLARYPAGTGNIDSSIDAITRTGSCSFNNTFSVVSRPENRFVPKLWAYTKIRELMDRMVVEDETNALVSEITNLSLEFGFVTPYTSLFVEVPVFDRISEATTEATTETYEEGDAADAEERASEAATAKATATRAPIWQGATDSASEAATEEAPAEVEPTEMAENAPGFGALFMISCLVVIARRVRRR